MGFPYTFPVGLPSSALGGAITGAALLDHQTAALGRLAEYLKNKPNVLATLQTLVQPAQDVEVGFQGLYQNRSVDTAQGTVLDALGKIVGEKRLGRDDPTMRPFVKARTLLNKSSGCPEEIYKLIGILALPGTQMRIYSEGTAAFALQLIGNVFTTSQINNLLSFVRLVRGGGIRGILEWETIDLTKSLHLNASPGLGTVADLTVGGRLSGASN